MVESLIISRKVTISVEKIIPQAPSVVHSAVCCSLTQQVQMHAECSTIVLIKWNRLGIFPPSFQKDLGGNSSLEKLQIVHLSAFKKNNIHTNEY